MRSFWSQVPMLRVAFPLMIGIGLEITAGNVPGAGKQTLWLTMAQFFVCLFFVLTVGLVKNSVQAYRLRVYNGLALTIILISFGYMLTWFYSQKNYANHFGKFLQEDSWVIAQIDEPPVVHEKIFTATAIVREVRNYDGQYKTTGNVQLNFMKDSLMRKPEYGDVILVKSKIEEVSGPKNPGEFNFKNYQGFHNIYHKAFLTKGSWQLLDSSKGNRVLAIVYRIRDTFLQIIVHYVNDKNDFGVASAIMLGYSDYENADIKRAYASSGTIHVLSVSGLHVGIMFLMLNFLLKWMDSRGRKWEIGKAAFIILFIWFYACLTGLSPPVLRSAMMFSLIQVGHVLIRNVNTYNIIAASAIILVLFDPFVLMDVGFQLSYIAVFGIVYLYPKISSLVVIRIPKDVQFKKQKHFYKLLALLRFDLKWLVFSTLDFFWQLIAVSIAAQIATLPLTLLYFYQFPNLFLISNLVVIPLSNLILFVGTALFVVGHIPYLNDIMGWVFNALLHLLDGFIFKIDQLPFALIKGISVAGVEMILLYVVVFFGCWLTEERRPKILIALLLVTFGLCSFNSYKQVQNANVKEIVVYSVPKQKAIAFISDKKVLYDFDSTLLNDQSAMSFHVRHNWWDLGVREEGPVGAKDMSEGRMVFFEGKRILIVDTNCILGLVKALKRKEVRDSERRKEEYFLSNPKVKSNIVILSGNPKVKLVDIMDHVDFDEIVFDSSNNPKRVSKWMEDCESLKIKCWSVSKQGAYIKKLSN